MTCHLMLRQSLSRWLCLLILLLTGKAAFAQTPINCSLNVTFNPAFPTTIQSVQTIGNVIYNGNVTYVWTCSTMPGIASVTGAPLAVGVGWGTTPTAITGMTGLTVDNRSSVSRTGSAGCSPTFLVPSNYPDSTQMGLLFASARTNCVLTMTLGMRVLATATEVKGTWPSATRNSSSLLTGNPFVVNSTGACGGAWSDAGRQASNGYVMSCTTTSNYTPPVVLSNTCTVSASNVAVNLPPVSTTALSGIGSTAGANAFTIALTGCNSSTSGFIGTQTWSFTQGPAANVIANSASGAAANVFTQILNNSGSPISNGGTVNINVPAAGGTVTQQYSARYYSTGSAGAGKVTGNATFNMTYN